MKHAVILLMGLFVTIVLARDENSASVCHANSAIPASDLESESFLQAIRIAQERICDGRRIAVHVPERNLEWVRKGIDPKFIEMLGEQQEPANPDVETFVVRLLRRSDQEASTRMFVGCTGGRGIYAVILVVFGKRKNEWYLDSADLYVQA